MFSVSPRPLGFWFGAKGLGPGLDNFLRVMPQGEKEIFSFRSGLRALCYISAQYSSL